MYIKKKAKHLCTPSCVSVWISSIVLVSVLIKSSVHVRSPTQNRVAK